MKRTGINFAAAHKDGAFSGNAEARTEMMEAINDYFREVMNAAPDSNLSGQPTQELGKSSIGEGAPLDFAYRELFKPVDLSGSMSEHHEIIDVTTGISFEQLEDGQPAKVRGVSSAKSTIKALIYGAGLGISDRWLRYNQFYRIEDGLQAAVRKYGFTEANNHYLLFAALAAGVNETFDTSIEKTVDNACDTIFNAVGDDYGLGDGTGFKVLTNRRNAALLEKALINPLYFDKAKIASNIEQVVHTSNSNIPATHDFGSGAKPFAYIVLPEHKLESITWLNLQAEEERNAAKRGTDIFWYGEHNCTIGETAQVRRIPLAA